MTKETNPWTDEEYGYIQDTMGEPIRVVAEALGRSYQAISKARTRVRRGVARVDETFWDASEIDYLRSSISTMTVVEIAKTLRRPLGAVYKKSQSLGLDPGTWMSKSPAILNGRTLLARTCIKCGELQDAKLFPVAHKGMFTTPRNKCRFCLSREAVERDRKKGRKNNYASSNENYKRNQALTLPTAVRNGFEYTDRDLEILSNPSMTLFEKAIRMQRTYAATCTAATLGGHESSGNKLENRDFMKWVIDNPNHPHPKPNK